MFSRVGLHLGVDFDAEVPISRVGRHFMAIFDAEVLISRVGRQFRSIFDAEGVFSRVGRQFGADFDAEGVIKRGRPEGRPRLGFALGPWRATRATRAARAADGPGRGYFFSALRRAAAAVASYMMGVPIMMEA